MTRAGWIFAVVVAACGGGKQASAPPPPAPQEPAQPQPEPVAGPAPVAVAVPDAAPAPEPDAAVAVAVAPPLDGADFTREAQLLFRVAACGNDAPLPADYDAKTVAVVDKHCTWIRERMTAFRETYFEGKGRAFFASLVPADAPTTVVYPFGGGDLISALVAFPDATEITTISLELAGDPRRIVTIAPKPLRDSLAAMRAEIGGLLSVGSNTSENLSASQRNELPAQVSSFLMGLAAGGYEPIAMRYFRLRPDGTIEYLTADAIAELEAAEAAARKGKRGAAKRKSSWQSPNFSEAFAHVEIRYRKVGDPTERIHRHFGWNLGNDYLAAHGELLAHLGAKGKVTLLTKGASYLLWGGGFSTIRQYMLDHLAWMLSDSTGIPPAFAKKAGMEQITYGSFSGAFLEGAEAHGKRHADDFRALWAKNPKRALPFRFGYVDLAKRAHLVVTRPAPPGP
jgi:hypothetical protein